jgi:hypothetical protein
MSFRCKFVKSLAAFDNRFCRINACAGSAADVDAEADALVVFFDSLPDVVLRWKLFVLRPVIVDG